MNLNKMRFPGVATSEAKLTKACPHRIYVVRSIPRDSRVPVVSTFGVWQLGVAVVECSKRLERGHSSVQLQGLASSSSVCEASDLVTKPESLEACEVA